MPQATISRDSRLWRAIVWTLRVSVALQCLGNATAVLRPFVGDPSKINSFLWAPADLGGLGSSEAAAGLVDSIGGWSLMAAAVLTLIRPCWPVLAPVTLWQVGLAAAKMWDAGDFASNLGFLFTGDVVFYTQAARIAAPICLILLDPWPRKTALSQTQVDVAMWLLRIAIAVTFIAHGYEALGVAAWGVRHNPRFIDYLILSAQNLCGYRLSQDAAGVLLNVIGVIDFVAAVLILCVRLRVVAFYMAFWGLVTAFSRITSAGLAGMGTVYPATLIRMAHAGVPLAVGLYWCLLKRSASPPELDESKPNEHDEHNDATNDQ